MLVSQNELIQKAIAGAVVSFPTDTVPALAVKPDNAALLYQVKQRPETKPLILMGASWSDLLPYITGSAEAIARWKRVADFYFPGALTLVLPASDLVPSVMNPTGSKTIGIRVPNQTVARNILAATGVLATTSANISGQSSIVTMNEINLVFPQVAVLKDVSLTDPLGNGTPSTVVQWRENLWQILRQGSVLFDHLV